ncbi:unnamed protein product, partial [Polarella glacialis]
MKSPAVTGLQKICRNWDQTVTCRFGDKCKFTHSLPSALGVEIETALPPSLGLASSSSLSSSSSCFAPAEHPTTHCERIARWLELQKGLDSQTAQLLLEGLGAYELRVVLSHGDLLSADQNLGMARGSVQKQLWNQRA